MIFEFATFYNQQKESTKIGISAFFVILFLLSFFFPSLFSKDAQFGVVMLTMGWIIFLTYATIQKHSNSSKNEEPEPNKLQEDSNES